MIEPLGTPKTDNKLWSITGGTKATSPVNTSTLSPFNNMRTNSQSSYGNFYNGVNNIVAPARIEDYRSDKLRPMDRLTHQPTRPEQHERYGEYQKWRESQPRYNPREPDWRKRKVQPMSFEDWLASQSQRRLGVATTLRPNYTRTTPLEYTPGQIDYDTLKGMSYR